MLTLGGTFCCSLTLQTTLFWLWQPGRKSRCCQYAPLPCLLLKHTLCGSFKPIIVCREKCSRDDRWVCLHHYMAIMAFTAKSLSEFYRSLFETSSVLQTLNSIDCSYQLLGSGFTAMVQSEWSFERNQELQYLQSDRRNKLWTICHDSIHFRVEADLPVLNA